MTGFFRMMEILGPYVSYFRVVSAIWEINQLNLYVDVCKYSDVTPFVIVNIFISNWFNYAIFHSNCNWLQLQIFCD